MVSDLQPPLRIFMTSFSYSNNDPDYDLKLDPDVFYSCSEWNPLERAWTRRNNGHLTKNVTSCELHFIPWNFCNGKTGWKSWSDFDVKAYYMFILSCCWNPEWTVIRRGAGMGQDGTGRGLGWFTCFAHRSSDVEGFPRTQPSSGGPEGRAQMACVAQQPRGSPPFLSFSFFFRSWGLFLYKRCRTLSA